MVRSRIARRIAAGAAALALAAVGVVITSAPANAAVIQVTSPADSGGGSLREAIGLANGPGGPHEITFQVGLAPITLTSGTIDITEPLTVTGPGASALTINLAGAFDMFTVNLATAGDVTMTGISLNSAAGAGRAIVVVVSAQPLEDLTLTDTRFSGFSSTAEGGAVAVNAASGGVTVTNSVFNSNLSTDPGGAIYVGTIGGTLGVSGSEFTTNSASEGGAIFAVSVGALVVQGSTFRQNSAASNGGAIKVGSATAASGIRMSTFTNNSVGAVGNPNSLGGAIHISLIPVGVQFDISQTSISDNNLTEGTAQSFGAGLFVDQTRGTLLVDSSTFNGGRFTTSGGSSAGAGLSIALCDVAASGLVRVINSTFDEASTVTDYAIHACDNSGTIQLLYSTFVVPGALFINSNVGGTASTYSSILDAVTNSDAVAIGGGNLVQSSWNLFSTPFNALFTVSSGGDRYSITNPGLGPLAANGGPTRTRLPLVGGAAYDSGDPNVAALTPPTWDQRGSGFPRIDGRIDIGAVEIPRTLPATGQPISGATGLASILLVIAGIGLVAQTRRAILRDRLRRAS